MRIVVGSRAAKFWYNSFRRPKDWDLVVTEDELANFEDVKSTSDTKYRSGKVELEPIRGDALKLLAELNADSPTMEMGGMECLVACPRTLLALKMSHLYFPLHWEKTIRDYHFLKHRVSLDEDFKRLLELRTQEKPKDKPPRYSLNVKNEDFFAGSERFVKRVFLHDDIHAATCYYDAPLWSRCKKDADKALIDEGLFRQLSHSDQIKMVQEEAFVIALERRIIPEPNWDEVDRARAFKYGLMRICTTLTRGWFRDFAVENYHEIRKLDYNYVEKFKQALQTGSVRAA